jgi:1,4-alpha-glucan branching enzyme
MSAPAWPVLGELDRYLFAQGTHRRLYRHLGSHVMGDATFFAVWAPNAREIDVIGDVGDWNVAHRLEPEPFSGIWTGIADGFRAGHRYRYRIHGADGSVVDKSDPLAAQTEAPPGTASVVADPAYDWGDAEWMTSRDDGQRADAPITIYEVHLGSWRGRDHDGRFPTYEELAAPLADHVEAHGFTHVELLPIMEHPFYGSWGYQITGYFAPTARYGAPTGLMRLIDVLHQRGLGVILDWVPSHFPNDAFGLVHFDGTHLYEHADPRQGVHPEWDSLIFNYGRHEVRSFLISSAMSWLDRYHADGLRVDAVASMLYLDYARSAGNWIPNRDGGRENLDAIEFLRDLNRAVREEHPGTATYAEESTAWPSVTADVDADVGGLGFSFKWDLGWMHDSLGYFGHDPVYRRWHHREMTFRTLYAASERFVLPLSHDEVVYGKGSLVGKMPGDDWQRLANVRLLLAWQWAQPGKKLLFMGAELAQRAEWNHEDRLEWWRRHEPDGDGMSRWICDLNRFGRAEPAMHAGDADENGWRWIEADAEEESVFSVLRQAPSARPVLIVLNTTPVPRRNHRIGVPRAGWWREALNSDAEVYGGSGVGNFGGAPTAPVEGHGWYHSLSVTLPPLGALFFVPDEAEPLVGEAAPVTPAK